MPLPRGVARFNRVVSNRIMRRFAGRAPTLGLVVNRGRTSGRTYRTPVSVFRRPGGFDVALTYGRGDWVKNVLAAGGAEVVLNRKTYEARNPRIVNDPEHRGVPAPVRAVLRLIRADEVLRLDISPDGDGNAS